MSMIGGKLGLNLGESDDELYTESDDEMSRESDDELYTESDDEMSRESDDESFWSDIARYTPLGILGSAGASLSAGGQRYPVQFDKRLVSVEEFNKTIGSLRGDIRRNRHSVSTLGKQVKTTNRRVKVIDRKVSQSFKKIKSKLDNLVTMFMLSSILTPEAKLASITFDDEATIEAGEKAEIKDSETVSQDGFSSMLPFMFGQNMDMMTMMLFMTLARNQK